MENQLKKSEEMDNVGCVSTSVLNLPVIPSTKDTGDGKNGDCKQWTFKGSCTRRAKCAFKHDDRKRGKGQRRFNVSECPSPPNRMRSLWYHSPSCDTYTMSLMLLDSVCVATVLRAFFCLLVTQPPTTKTLLIHRAHHSIHAVIPANSTTCVLDLLAIHPSATDVSSIFSTFSSWLRAAALTGNSEHHLPTQRHCVCQPKASFPAQSVQRDRSV